MPSKCPHTKAIESPFTEKCTCGNPTFDYMRMEYPNGRIVYIPICKVCMDEVEKAFKLGNVDL